MPLPVEIDRALRRAVRRDFLPRRGAVSVRTAERLAEDELARLARLARETLTTTRERLSELNAIVGSVAGREAALGEIVETGVRAPEPIGPKRLQVLTINESTTTIAAVSSPELPRPFRVLQISISFQPAEQSASSNLVMLVASNNSDFTTGFQDSDMSLWDSRVITNRAISGELPEEITNLGLGMLHGPFDVDIPVPSHLSRLRFIVRPTSAVSRFWKAWIVWQQITEPVLTTVARPLAVPSLNFSSRQAINPFTGLSRKGVNLVNRLPASIRSRVNQPVPEGRAPEKWVRVNKQTGVGREQLDAVLSEVERRRLLSVRFLEADVNIDVLYYFASPEEELELLGLPGQPAEPELTFQQAVAEFQAKG